jgi:hypothetical protein
MAVHAERRFDGTVRLQRADGGVMVLTAEEAKAVAQVAAGALMTGAAEVHLARHRALGSTTKED